MHPAFQWLAAHDANPILALKPVAWWRGEDNALDSAGANGGTWSGTAAYAAGTAGQAFDFDGASYVNPGQPDPLRITGALTISMFVNRAAGTGIVGLFSRYVTATADRAYALFSGTSAANRRIGINLSASGAAALAFHSTTDLPVAISHVAAVYKPSEYVKLFLDGEEFYSSTTGVPASLFDADTDALIGRYVPADGNVTGQIDECLVFNRALSAAEIATLANPKNYRGGK